MKHNKNVLSFTVNESLYVEGMEGIEEILAISLDPDIVIETFYEDVKIRGLIILQGEYKKSADHQENIDQENDNEKTIQVMEKMIETEKDQVMFSHRFPVEVTVAEDRITDMNDVKVEVVTFDYEIPSNYRLNITAKLHIHGILNDNALKDNEKKQEQDKIEEMTDDTEDPPPEIEQPEINNQELPRAEEEEQAEEVPPAEVKEEKEVPTKLKRKPPKETEDTNLTEGTEMIEDSSDRKHEKIVNHMEKINENEETIDIQLTENEALEEQDEVEDVLFLTDLFANTKEESVTTMRIHIIQAGDTIESVAKRYDMSALQLMKDNQLNADEMTPGKLIYIQQNK